MYTTKTRVRLTISSSSPETAVMYDLHEMPKVVGLHPLEQGKLVVKGDKDVQLPTLSPNENPAS